MKTLINLFSHAFSLKMFQFPVVSEVSINTLNSKSTSEILMEIKDQEHSISNGNITELLVSP